MSVELSIMFYPITPDPSNLWNPTIKQLPINNCQGGSFFCGSSHQVVRLSIRELSYTLILKANRPHQRNYPRKHPTCRHTYIYGNWLVIRPVQSRAFLFLLEFLSLFLYFILSLFLSVHQHLMVMPEGLYYSIRFCFRVDAAKSQHVICCNLAGSTLYPQLSMGHLTNEMPHHILKMGISQKNLSSLSCRVYELYDYVCCTGQRQQLLANVTYIFIFYCNSLVQTEG